MNAAENQPDANTVHHHDNTSRWQWTIVVGLGVVALVLGTIGFLHGKGADGQPQGTLDAFYNSMRLFHMHFEQAPYPLPWELQIARFLAPLVLVVTLFKGFIFVARSHRHAFIHRSKSGHVVICGLGQKGLQLARQCRRQGKWVIVIEKNPHNELLSICDDEEIFYWIGDATEPAVLAHARAVHAKEIIIVTPEDETNLRIAMQIRKLVVPDGHARPECFVHLENIHLRERLQRVFENESERNAGCGMSFFDVYDGEARRILLELPLDGAGITKDDPRTVHVVILGFGRMGRSLALRAAKMGHFANGKKLRISVIDRTSDRHREHFLFHYPMLEKDTICDLKFHQAEVQSLTARKLIEGWAAEKDTLLHLFVCLDENASAVEVGLRLQEMLANRPDCNLCVRVKTRSSLAEILESSPRIGPQIRAFGMLEDASCDLAFRREYNESIARAIHEQFVNKRLGDSIRRPENDPALQPWEMLREDLRESNRQQADHITIKLRAIGFKLKPASDNGESVTKFAPAEIELLAPVEHRRWNVERWLAGWHYGTPSDKANRISENLVSWDELHDSIRDYDRKAVEMIPTLVAQTNPPMKVVRKIPSSRTATAS